MSQYLPLIAVFLAPIGTAQELPATVEFSRDIRPLLSDRCFLCHGPDEANRKVNLRLDTEAGAKKRQGKTTPIAPGDPAASEVIRRITADNSSRMPPAYAGLKALSARDIALIRRSFRPCVPRRRQAIQSITSSSSGWSAKG